MPDANGVLTQAERQTIATLMKTKLKLPACAWCGSPNWELGPFITVSPSLQANGSVGNSAQVMPLLSLVSPCGHVAHFAAKKFGLEIRAPGASAGQPAPA